MYKSEVYSSVNFFFICKHPCNHPPCQDKAYFHYPESYIFLFLKINNNSFFLLATSQGMWDLSSPTRDLTWASCIRSKESSPLDLKGVPSFHLRGAFHGSSGCSKYFTYSFHSHRLVTDVLLLSLLYRQNHKDLERLNTLSKFTQIGTEILGLLQLMVWPGPDCVGGVRWRFLRVRQFSPPLLFTAHLPLHPVLGQQAVCGAFTGGPSGRGPGLRRCPTPVSAAWWAAGALEIDLDCCSHKRCPPVSTQLALFGKVTVLTNLLLRSPGQNGCLSIFRLPKPCLCNELKTSSENPSCF